MPIPINTDYFLAQVVARPDLDPEANSYVNTFFFRNDGAADVGADIKSALDAFYNVANGGAATSIVARLSPVINPALTEYRVYDLGQAVPRTPDILPATWGTTGGAGQPSEVAACISYYAGTNVPRKRGRVFIGPLSTAILGSTGAGASDVLIDSSFVNTLKQAALNLLNTSENIEWTQYSRVANVMSAVTAGWVDNAFDIQRRRGAPGTIRETW